MRWMQTLALVGLLALAADVDAAPKNRELVGSVNLNNATVEQLVLLPGVGPATARRIVEAREKRPFQRPWEVVRVKGIGPGFFQKHKERLKVEGATDLAWVEVDRGRTARR